MASTDPPFPWHKLPDELKLEILQYALLSDQPEDLHSRKLLGPLLLTSKRMGRLAHEARGRNPLYIRLPSTARRMQYIHPDVGRYVRILDLKLELPEPPAWHHFTYTPWCVLLFCNRDDKPLSSHWQTALPLLVELNLSLFIKTSDKKRSKPTPSEIKQECVRREEMEEAFIGASCDLHAKRVKVGVYGLLCGEYPQDPKSNPVGCTYRCAERLAMSVKAIIERKKL